MYNFFPLVMNPFIQKLTLILEYANGIGMITNCILRIPFEIKSVKHDPFVVLSAYLRLIPCSFLNLPKWTENPAFEWCHICHDILKRPWDWSCFFRVCIIQRTLCLLLSEPSFPPSQEQKRPDINLITYLLQHKTVPMSQIINCMEMRKYCFSTFVAMFAVNTMKIILKHSHAILVVPQGIFKYLANNMLGMRNTNTCKGISDYLTFTFSTRIKSKTPSWYYK